VSFRPSEYLKWSGVAFAGRRASVDGRAAIGSGAEGARALTKGFRIFVWLFRIHAGRRFSGEVLGASTLAERQSLNAPFGLAYSRSP